MIELYLDTGDSFRLIARIPEGEIARFVATLPGSYRGCVYVAVERIATVYFLNVKGMIKCR